ncbi:MAG: STAS domain-containing protein [Planctomycetaceae bacterium]|nr:STAS domain-containing protein [Planctomycetaceae bacterium]
MFELEKHGAVHVIHGDGPLNVDFVESVGQLLEECLDEGLPRVVVDLKRVPLIDSAGIELILDYRDKCQRMGGDLKLAAPNRLCEDILFVTGVEQDVEVLPEVLRAVGSFVR